jgi:hypothetical protein
MGFDVVSAPSDGIWNPQTMSDKLVAATEQMLSAFSDFSFTPISLYAF